MPYVFIIKNTNYIFINKFIKFIEVKSNEFSNEIKLKLQQMANANFDFDIEKATLQNVFLFIYNCNILINKLKKIDKVNKSLLSMCDFI